MASQVPSPESLLQVPKSGASVGVLVVVLVNLSFYAIGQLQLQHRQQQWQQWLELQPLTHQAWLVSEQGQLKLLSSPPKAAADFVALD